MAREPKFRALYESKIYEVDCLCRKTVSLIMPDGEIKCGIRYENIVLIRSTGLKDKNGKEEFYHKDLIKVCYENKEFIGVVEQSISGDWIIVDNGGLLICVLWDFINDSNYSGGKIGNVYEHPELIKNSE